MAPEELKWEKETFLKLYNRYRTNCQAASDAVKSASQHNALYAVGLSERERACVRETWKALLCELAHRYRRTVSKSQYEMDIETLKQRMNDRFADCLRSDGFKVSHAQKSLSVFLKHLWCMDVIETPPQCPVDSIILERAGLRYPETRWAYMNSIEEHRRKVACLAQCAAACGMGLAEWELRTF